MESSPLLNSLVSDLEDGTVQELLAAERCTTETDKKDYVIAAAVSLSPSACVFPPPPHLFISPLSHSLVFLHSPISFTTVAVLLIRPHRMP